MLHLNKTSATLNEFREGILMMLPNLGTVIPVGIQPCSSTLAIQSSSITNYLAMLKHLKQAIQEIKGQ